MRQEAGGKRGYVGRQVGKQAEAKRMLTMLTTLQYCPIIGSSFKSQSIGTW